MSIRIVRLGTPRVPAEGLRIGTVRRPPRGVRTAALAKRDYYDVWLPELSPSAPLVKMAQSSATPAAWKRFVRRYRTEMAAAPATRILDLLAALSRSTNVSVGCYCEDESRCHRSVLRDLLIERGAEVR